ncbi:DMT family transporter [Pendulispora albinea]|uniref:DMT family transporter n=1 Tax=Pendulispora albinea TaxID=2741071 RepID=A0ABZ2LYX5_9BACT
MDTIAVVNKNVAYGVLAACGAQTLVGASAAVSVLLVNYPVLGGQALRYAVATLIFLMIARAQGIVLVKLDRRDVLRLMLLSATGLVGFNVCILLALRYTQPTTLGTVIGCTPIVLALATPLLEGQRPGLRLVGAAVLVSLGAAIAQGFGGGDPIGFLLAAGALAGGVLFSLLAVPLLPKLGALRLSMYVCGAAVPMLLLAGILADGSGVVRMPTVQELLALAYLSLLLSALAFLLWYSAIVRLGADRAGLFTGLVPVAAAGASMALGTGRPSGAQLVGMALVVFGVLVGLGAKSASRPEGAHGDLRRAARAGPMR